MLDELDDRDRRLVEAVDRIGPVTPHALAFHPIESRFDTVDEFAGRLERLANAGHLSSRTVVDVSGDRLSEYDIPVSRAEETNKDTGL